MKAYSPTNMFSKSVDYSRVDDIPKFKKDWNDLYIYSKTAFIKDSAAYKVLLIAGYIEGKGYSTNIADYKNEFFNGTVANTWKKIRVGMYTHKNTKVADIFQITGYFGDRDLDFNFIINFNYPYWLYIGQDYGELCRGYVTFSEGMVNYSFTAASWFIASGYNNILMTNIITKYNSHAPGVILFNPPRVFVDPFKSLTSCKFYSYRCNQKPYVMMDTIQTKDGLISLDFWNRFPNTGYTKRSTYNFRKEFIDRVIGDNIAAYDSFYIRAMAIMESSVMTDCQSYDQILKILPSRVNIDVNDMVHSIYRFASIASLHNLDIPIAYRDQLPNYTYVNRGDDFILMLLNYNSMKFFIVVDNREYNEPVTDLENFTDIEYTANNKNIKYQVLTQKYYNFDPDFEAIIASGALAPTYRSNVGIYSFGHNIHSFLMSMAKALPTLNYVNVTLQIDALPSITKGWDGSFPHIIYSLTSSNIIQDTRINNFTPYSKDLDPISIDTLYDIGEAEIIADETCIHTVESYAASLSTLSS